MTLDRLTDLDVVWAPRFIGIDGDSEILSWLPGEPLADWSDRPELLDDLARIVRCFHDVTADLAPGHECLVHDDLQPRNVVVDGDRPGLIDWEQVRPGRRIEDVAQLCWAFAVPELHDAERVGWRWRRVLDAYDLTNRGDVVPASLTKIARCVDAITRQAAEGSARHQLLHARGDHEELARLWHWIDANGEILAESCQRVIPRPSLPPDRR